MSRNPGSGGGGGEVDPSERDGGTNFDEAGAAGAAGQAEEQVDPSEDKE